MSGPYGGSMTYRHLDGSECLHRLAKDSEAPEGVYCTVTHSDVLLDDGGPTTGRITVVLNDEDGRFRPDEPLRPVFPSPVPPPSRYLDGPERRRHRAEPVQPGMFTSWPEAMKFLGMWALFSAVVLGVLIGLVWLLIHVLS